jgi:hypothetical protein
MKTPATTIAAMCCITALEIVALLQGFDGILLTTVVSVLSGLGGYELRKAMSGGK